MRITFRKEAPETGLARVTAGPRGYEIRVDGKMAGRCSMMRNGYKYEWHGWYFYATYSGLSANTCSSPVETLEEVKAAAKAWIQKVVATGDSK